MREIDEDERHEAIDQRRAAHLSTRCVDGRTMRHDPQPDDPNLETDIGKCKECGGEGCADKYGNPTDGSRVINCDDLVDDKGKWIDDNEWHGEHCDECPDCGARMKPIR